MGCRQIRKEEFCVAVKTLTRPFGSLIGQQLHNGNTQQRTLRVIPREGIKINLGRVVVETRASLVHVQMIAIVEVILLQGATAVAVMSLQEGT